MNLQKIVTNSCIGLLLVTSIGGLGSSIYHLIKSSQYKYELIKEGVISEKEKKLIKNPPYSEKIKEILVKKNSSEKAYGNSLLLSVATVATATGILIVKDIKNASDALHEYHKLKGN